LNAPRCLFILGFILLQSPFTFPPYHKALREPFDYYMFGQNYIRPLVDFR
jgi:glycerol-3-phosphate O-acyltransferase